MVINPGPSVRSSPALKFKNINTLSTVCIIEKVIAMIQLDASVERSYVKLFTYHTLNQRCKTASPWPSCIIRRRRPPQLRQCKTSHDMSQHITWWSEFDTRVLNVLHLFISQIIQLTLSQLPTYDNWYSIDNVMSPKSVALKCSLTRNGGGGAGKNVCIK